MAVCPSCHSHDKDFWASKCHACNSEIGFFDQVFYSLVWTATQIGCLVGLWYLLKWAFSG